MRRNAAAKIMKQHLEVIFFVRLRLIVFRPFLGIRRALGDFERFGNRGGSVEVKRLLDYMAHGQDVLARLTTKFIIWTRAVASIARHVNSVFLWAALRRNNPFAAAFNNAEFVCNLDCFLL